MALALAPPGGGQILSAVPRRKAHRCLRQRSVTAHHRRCHHPPKCAGNEGGSDRGRQSTRHTGPSTPRGRSQPPARRHTACARNRARGSRGAEAWVCPSPDAHTHTHSGTPAATATSMATCFSTRKPRSREVRSQDPVRRACRRPLGRGAWGPDAKTPPPSGGTRRQPPGTLWPEALSSPQPHCCGCPRPNHPSNIPLEVPSWRPAPDCAPPQPRPPP